MEKRILRKGYKVVTKEGTKETIKAIEKLGAEMYSGRFYFFNNIKTAFFN